MKRHGFVFCYIHIKQSAKRTIELTCIMHEYNNQPYRLNHFSVSNLGLFVLKKKTKAKQKIQLFRGG